jgi:hypothetical protein
MQTLYVVLAAVHMIAVVVTGILWIVIDLVPQSRLRRHLRDIRAVHFGSLYLVPWFLGLAWAFQRLQVPTWHQAVFPGGLAVLVLFAGIAYLLPRPSELDSFYYWIRGPVLWNPNVTSFPQFPGVLHAAKQAGPSLASPLLLLLPSAAF